MSQFHWINQSSAHVFNLKSDLVCPWCNQKHYAFCLNIYFYPWHTLCDIFSVLLTGCSNCSCGQKTCYFLRANSTVKSASIIVAETTFCSVTCCSCEDLFDQVGQVVHLHPNSAGYLLETKALENLCSYALSRYRNWVNEFTLAEWVNEFTFKLQAIIIVNNILKT